MQYSVGQPGRTVVARLETGDSIYDSIHKIATAESIISAAVWIIGGIKNGKVIVGPKKDDEFPPDVIVREFSDAREILGVGTIFPDEEGMPSLHMHAAIGKEDNPLVGCPRMGADCWLVNEVVIQEIVGMHAVRANDPASGLALLHITGNQAAASRAIPK